VTPAIPSSTLEGPVTDVLYRVLVDCKADMWAAGVCMLYLTYMIPLDGSNDELERDVDAVVGIADLPSHIKAQVQHHLYPQPNEAMAVDALVSVMVGAISVAPGARMAASDAKQILQDALTSLANLQRDTDFVRLRQLDVESACADSIHVVQCAKLEALGYGDIFVMKTLRERHDTRRFYYADAYGTLAAEVSTNLAIPPESRHLFCTIIYHACSRPYYYTISSYCSGGDLRNVLRDHPELLTQANVAKWALSLAEGLLVIHRQLHRLHMDLKLDNVFYLPSKNAVQIADMGISQVILKPLSQLLSAFDSKGLCDHYDGDGSFTPTDYCWDR